MYIFSLFLVLEKVFHLHDNFVNSVSESVKAMEVCQYSWNSGFDVFDVNQNVMSPILTGMIPTATVAPASSSGAGCNVPSLAFNNQIGAVFGQVRLRLTFRKRKCALVDN